MLRSDTPYTMAIPSLQDRLARTKRTQARALSGQPASVPVPAVPVANDSRHQESVAFEGAQDFPFDRASHLAEFNELLPVIAQHYGYSEQDAAYMRKAVSAATPITNLEVVLCVRQWRIDIVTHGLGGQLPAGSAMRAWIQFRQTMRGKTDDEAGEPYGEAALQRPIEQPEVRSPAEGQGRNQPGGW